MATKQKPVDSIDIVPTSLKDAGYRSARFGEGLSTVAKYILEQQPDIETAGPSDTIKEGLFAGWELRYSELHPAVRYTQEWNPIPDGAPDVEGMTLVGVEFAMSFSQQEFGKLKGTEPGKHGAIFKVRDAFIKYRAQRLKDLLKAIRDLSAKDKPRTRTQANDFSEYLKATFESMKTRNKNAKSRGDTSAVDEVKLRMAIDAFNAKLV